MTIYDIFDEKYISIFEMKTEDRLLMLVIKINWLIKKQYNDYFESDYMEIFGLNN